MKINMCLIMVFVVLVSLFSMTATANEEDASVITVTLNGKELGFDVVPRLINDRAMVPMRVIFEALGASVDWDNYFKIITSYTDDGSMIRLEVGSNELILRTKLAELKYITLDTPPQIIDDRTFVPVRAVAESFGADVGWNQENKTVIITHAPKMDLDEVTVSTAEEFMKAICSYRSINVTPGVYDFAQWNTGAIYPVGGILGVHVSGVKNLNIIGSDSGNVEFKNTSELGMNLIFDNCENINIENIYFNDNGFSIMSSKGILLKNITSHTIYVAGGSKNIIFDNLKVTKGDFADEVVFIISSDVVFKNAEIIDNKNVNCTLFSISDSYVKIENSVISGNSYNPKWELLSSNLWAAALFHLTDNANVVLSDTIVTGNTFRHKISSSPSGNIEYEDGTFKDNIFDSSELFETGEPVG